jgi:hypothetical protein
MRFDGITAAALRQDGHAHGHHVRGDADPQLVRGSDVFEFRDIGDVSGVVVGRIEDFDSSRDRLLIEGQDIGLADGFASCDIDGNHIRIVRYNGDHNDPDADPQQWLLIERPAAARSSTRWRVRAPTCRLTHRQAAAPRAGRGLAPRGRADDRRGPGAAERQAARHARRHRHRRRPHRRRRRAPARDRAGPRLWRYHKPWAS